MSTPLTHVVPHLCGMARAYRLRSLAVAMKAFFDESGLSPYEDKVLVMGGYLGTVGEWERVAEAWDECLRRSPRIEYFKSDEAKRLSGQFERFNHDMARAKTKELAAIIGASDLQGFCVSVLHAWFEGRDPKALKGIPGSRAYDWGFYAATSGVLHYAQDFHPGEIIDFVFDRRTELRGCIATYEEMKSTEDTPWSEIMKTAGACVPGDDEKVAALQMADLLAGEFSNMANAENPPSDLWKLLTERHSVAHIPCEMPPLIPFLGAIRALGKEIQTLNGRFLKKFYKEGDRSPGLLDDFGEIAERKAFFDLAMRFLQLKYESDPEYIKFRDRYRKK